MRHDGLKWGIGLALAAVLLPLVSSAQAPMRSPLVGDSRLEKRITVQWKKATLYDALQEVGKATGVRLLPEMGLVDEPVMAAAQDVRAVDLLDRLAVLLRFQWMRSGGTAERPNYVLTQSRAAREEEQAEIDKQRRAILDALQKEITRLDRLSKLPPDALQREQQRVESDLEQSLAGGLVAAAANSGATRTFQEAQAYSALGSPIGRSLVDLLLGLTPAQWQRVLDEEPLSYSTQPEPGDLRMPGNLEGTLRGSTPGFFFPKSIFRSLGMGIEDGIRQVEGMMSQEWGKAAGYRVTVQFTGSAAAQPVGILQVTPSPEGNGVSSALFAASGLMVMGIPDSLLEAEEDPAAREARLAADPVLGRKAKFELPEPKPQPAPFSMLGAAHRVADVLIHVEKAFGVQLLGDAYNRLALSMVKPPAAAQMPLFKVLDLLAGTARRWERDGDFIRFKSKTWAMDRRGEVPMRLMRAWLAQRERQGGLSLDNMAEIAARLRDQQVDSLMFAALEAGAPDFTDFTFVTSNRDLLRFYGRLIPPQRGKLSTPAGLAAGELFPYQQPLLLKALSPKGGGAMFGVSLTTRKRRTPATIAGAVLKLSRQDSARPIAAPAPPGGAEGPVAAGATVYQITVTYPEGQPDVFMLPVSRRPPAR